MTKDEALKLALEALERSVATCFNQYAHQQVMSQPDHFINTAITAIKEALANVATNDTSKESVDEMQKQRHEKEPVVGTKTWFEDGKVVTQYLYPSDIYTTPPQRTWQGLTDKAITQVIDSMPKNMKGFMVDWDLYEFAQTIEAKLKQKNGFAEEKNK